jgi:hypothetical protein
MIISSARLISYFSRIYRVATNLYERALWLVDHNIKDNQLLTDSKTSYHNFTCTTYNMYRIYIGYILYIRNNNLYSSRIYNKWMIFGEKIELKVYVNQYDLYQIYKPLHGHDFFCVLPWFINEFHKFYTFIHYCTIQMNALIIAVG